MVGMRLYMPLTKSEAKRMASSHKQRAKSKYGLTEHFTAEEWIALCQRNNYHCVICGIIPEKLSPDHMMPLARGGSNKIDNIMPTRLPCNLRKHTKIYVWSPQRVNAPKRRDPYKAWYTWKPYTPPKESQHRANLSLLCSALWSIWPLILSMGPLVIGSDATLYVFLVWQVWGFLSIVFLD